MKKKLLAGLVTCFFVLGIGILLIPNQVLATPFTFTYETAITSTNIPGTSVADTFILDVIVDNGGTNLLNQTWNVNDVTSAVATLGSYTATFGAPHYNYPDLFKTDSAGNLTFAQFADIGGNNSDSLGSSPSISINQIFYYSGTSYAANFAEGSQYNLSVWTGPPVSSPVPEPATMFLFGLGLLGLAGVNRKNK